MERLKVKFDLLKRNNKKALVSFISSCDPNFTVSKQILFALPKSGADIIEIGLPFSDPMADGPTIQKSSLRAIQSGFSLTKTFNMVCSFRAIDNTTPVVFMGYFNTFYQFGLKKFFVEAKKNGIDGILIVDLPPEEYKQLSSYEKKYNINLIRLVTPTTKRQRLKMILKNSSGFIYYVSIMGITGTKQPSLKKVRRSVEEIKKNTDLPVLVGFGIKQRDQVNEISKFADGSVIGSSLIKIIEESIENKVTPKNLVKRINRFVKSLK